MHDIKPHQTKLANGLRLITLPLQNTRAVTLLVLVGTGAMHEQKKQMGISHLLEHMAFKGTTKRPTAQVIAEELDAMGGIYNAFTGKEYTGFWVKVEEKHLANAADILADVLFNSLLKTEELEREKLVVKEEINMYLDTPQDYVGELWEELLYGDQPAGWPIIGSKESVSALSSADLAEYMGKQFSGQNTIIVAAGAVDEKSTPELLTNYFNGFKNQAVAVRVKTSEVQQLPGLLARFKSTDQTHLCLGARGLNLHDERRYVMSVLAVLLGGIMSSRLFTEIREKRGLAYYISTGAQFYSDVGYLVTQAGVNNSKAAMAVELILQEYKKLTTELVPANELAKVKEAIKGKLSLGLETSDDWATYLASQELLQGKISLPGQEYVKIEKVTAPELRQLARDIFQNSKLNLALIGPVKDGVAFKKLLSLS